MSDNVNHPDHYGGDTVYETIKVIEAWNLGFNLGNTVKYISRAGKKGGDATTTDLKKARWYLDREIANRERAERPDMIQCECVPPGSALLLRDVADPKCPRCHGTGVRFA